MFDIECNDCKKRFSLKNIRVDEHWREATKLGRAYCYCPHCGSVLNYVKPDIVELANKITYKNITLIILSFALLLIGEITKTLTYVAPTLIIFFGVFLIKGSKLKDHRIIGWLLTIFFSIILIWLNYNA